MRLTIFGAAAAVLALASSTEASGRRWPSRAQLWRKIEDLRAQVAKLTAENTEIGFECPVNSHSDASLGFAPNSFDDCVCDEFYIREDDVRCVREVTLRVNNLSFLQPFGGFFVAVHNSETPRFYSQGQPASEGLRTLAEDGNPAPLVEDFGQQEGVLSAFVFPGPLAPGGVALIKVRVNDDYPQVSIGSMAINTNDCFVALNGVDVQAGGPEARLVLNTDGIDAGTEENNEKCGSIPGPACSPESGNERSNNGEGFVHIHRGFHGVNEGKNLTNPLDNGVSGMPLRASRYDWRNPMMRVTIQ